MKRYKNGTINNLENKLSIKETRKILEQLILAQLNGFYKYGFIHNEINLTNILYRISEKEEEFIYNVCKDILSNKENESCLITTKKIKNKEIIPILFDFDKSHCFNPEIYEKYSENFFDDYSFDDNEILLINLLSTILECIKLIDKEKENKEYIKIENEIYSIINGNQFQNELYRWSVKSLDKYSRGMINWENFRDVSISNSSIFINKIIKLFDVNINLINNKCIIDLKFKE